MLLTPGLSLDQSEASITSIDQSEASFYSGASQRWREEWFDKEEENGDSWEAGESTERSLKSETHTKQLLKSCRGFHLDILKQQFYPLDYDIPPWKYEL